MGCCGSTSNGPSSASYAAYPPDPKTGAPTGPRPWRVTRRDGTSERYASQVVAHAEAGVNGGVVEWVQEDPPATV